MKSIKIFDGFSCCFRQWKAEDTHCKFLHGYAISFEVTFEGALDDKNWVWNFGGMKRAKYKIEGMNPKEWMDYMFDHTTIVALDDPYLNTFKDLEKYGLIQLRILNNVGAEKFAEFIYHKLDDFVRAETYGRVKVAQVKFMENGKNSAIFEAEN
jgi:6-pyruvoyltetrahydropterin/6-carboxytetrahydropterin synthase